MGQLRHALVHGKVLQLGGVHLEELDAWVTRSELGELGEDLAADAAPGGHVVDDHRARGSGGTVQLLLERCLRLHFHNALRLQLGGILRYRQGGWVLFAALPRARLPVDGVISALGRAQVVEAILVHEADLVSVTVLQNGDNHICLAGSLERDGRVLDCVAGARDQLVDALRACPRGERNAAKRSAVVERGAAGQLHQLQLGLRVRVAEHDRVRPAAGAGHVRELAHAKHVGVVVAGAREVLHVDGCEQEGVGAHVRAGDGHDLVCVAVVVLQDQLAAVGRGQLRGTAEVGVGGVQRDVAQVVAQHVGSELHPVVVRQLQRKVGPLRAESDHGLGPSALVGAVASGLASSGELLVAENMQAQNVLIEAQRLLQIGNFEHPVQRAPSVASS
mmetsp:Transcript_10092/g.31828  ORF Transcript_10092/g.31828 Transcript_10092/m.31828 type:complete len:390 (-) Transcript_10092:82-1251(-)